MEPTLEARLSQRRETRAEPVVRGDLALRYHRPDLDISVRKFNSPQRRNTVEADQNLRPYQTLADQDQQRLAASDDPGLFSVVF